MEEIDRIKIIGALIALIQPSKESYRSLSALISGAIDSQFTAHVAGVHLLDLHPIGDIIKAILTGLNPALDLVIQHLFYIIRLYAPDLVPEYLRRIAALATLPDEKRDAIDAWLDDGYVTDEDLAPFIK
jgi:hypothetical protein